MKLLLRALEWLFIPFMLVAVVIWLTEDWIRGRKIGTMDFEEEA